MVEKIKVVNEAAMAAGAGTVERASEINSGVRAGSSVGGKGFREERDGRQRLDSGDVWDLNGIHLLTADGVSCVRSGEAHSVRPLEPDPDAEQIQRVPGDGMRRGEL